MRRLRIVTGHATPGGEPPVGEDASGVVLMAQVTKRGPLVRARRLARRYGVTGRAAGAGALCLLAAVLGVAGALFWGSADGVTVQRAAPASEEAAAASDAASEAQGASESPVRTIVVHVDGAVAAPGVYAVAEGARVNDAVAAAGGLRESADTSTVNLASVVSDGAKVHIPTTEELQAPVTSSGDAASAGGAAANGLVNINTATSAELQTLSGVGEATAAAIIEDRESNGPFSSAEDLMRVSGIGEKKFAKIKDRICV